ncbi:cbb3-type cytochrome c oxidase subunit I [Acidobacteriota bacterium]
MTTKAPAMAAQHKNFYEEKKGIMSWLLTTDHKRIGLLYLLLIVIFFFFGAAMAFTMRLELIAPGEDFIGPDTYNRILTLHGVAMIFLFIIPGIPAIFGNFFLPIQIGAPDVAFPRLNLLSWYCYIAGAVLALVAIIAGGPDTGWTFYVPYSATTSANVFWVLLAAVILGWSSILTGINFIATIHRLRAPGMSWFRMPLFCWALYATAWTQVIATPVVGMTLILVILERFLGVGVFDPTLGGDPVLYQHLFWIYSHPAVYIMVLPAMGLVSEIIPTFSRKTIFGYKFIAFSSLAIAGLGSLVWGHHMFTSGMGDFARIVFSFLTFLVAVPSAIKVFNWLATMYRGSIKLDPPMLFALMFIFLFSIGGFTGLMQGALSTDIALHDTSFIVAHFHFTMFGGTGAMFFAGLLYWFPKMFGRMYNIAVAKFGAGLFFVGFLTLYVPLFAAGLAGQPRRYADYLPEYTMFHRISTIGSWIVITALLITFINLVIALFKGKLAGDNPWGGTTLEWQTATPPPLLNFEKTPEVTEAPYTYPEKVNDD